MRPEGAQAVPGGGVEGGGVGVGAGGGRSVAVATMVGGGGDGDAGNVLEEESELVMVAGGGVPVEGEGGVLVRALEGELAETGKEVGLEGGGEVAAGEGEGTVVVGAEMVCHHVEDIGGHV